DLAVLKIEGDKEFPILPLGKAEDVNVGDWVVAIGNPYGFDHTVTVGVLSAKERPISIPDSKGTREYKHLLQTDASINPGNSGGPLLNLNGEVIGINTAVSSQAQGIGFAIPTSTISSVLENLKNNVQIPKEPVPYLGVGLQDIGKDWVSELKLSNTDGALVGSVQ
ncbi:S1C family serine protease, partial [Paenibacillus sp. TAF58]